jgi:light-regulated signal transduction histidine kinase (bacteriophytochrome)
MTEHSKSSAESRKDALIESLRDEIAVTNRGIVALNLELDERMLQLELLNEELRSFAYSVSHDLRQPLRAIDGFTGILEEDYSGQLDSQANDYLGRIRASVTRMNAMIDGLLNLSRATRKEMARQDVELDAVARTILGELRAREPERQVQVQIDTNMTVVADAQLMESVMQNLLSNAWKYSANQPDARISFRREDAEGERVFVVEDNGAGFDMHYADKLFKVFQRLHSAEEYEGAGIGLATAQRIIRRHGGRLWAKGQPNLGATFMFTIPGPR